MWRPFMQTSHYGWLFKVLTKHATQEQRSQLAAGIRGERLSHFLIGLITGMLLVLFIFGLFGLFG